MSVSNYQQLVESRVPLLGPVIAMPRCGIYLKLECVGEAAAFLHRHLTSDRASQLDCIRAEKLLEVAASTPSTGLRQVATIAVRDILRSENMLG
jgi:hypothetical protein